MIGELALGGVYLPILLVIGAAALVLTALLSRLLVLISAYRFFAYRPLVDIALFIMLMGLITWLVNPAGAQP